MRRLPGDRGAELGRHPASLLPVAAGHADEAGLERVVFGVAERGVRGVDQAAELVGRQAAVPERGQGRDLLGAHRPAPWRHLRPLVPCQQRPGPPEIGDLGERLAKRLESRRSSPARYRARGEERQPCPRIGKAVMAVMTPRDPVGRVVLRTVLIVVSVVLVLYLIYLLRTPITWLVIAAFIAVAVSGPVNLLQRRMKRGFAVAIVYAALVMIPIGLGALIIPSLVGQIENLGENVPQYAQDVTDFVNNNNTLNDLNDKYDFTGELQSLADDLPSKIGDAAGVLQDIGVGVVNSIFAAVTILILSIFMVVGRAALGGGVRPRAAAGAGRADRAGAAAHRQRDRQLRRWGLGAGDDRRGLGLHRPHDPRRPVRGAPGADRRLLRPDPGRRRNDRRRPHRRGDDLRQLPGRADRLDRLRDPLPAVRELRDPAADPAAGRRDRAVRRPRLGPLRLDPVRDPGCRARDPGRGDPADHLARVPRLPAREPGGPAGKRRAVARSSRL